MIDGSQVFAERRDAKSGNVSNLFETKMLSTASCGSNSAA